MDQIPENRQTLEQVFLCVRTLDDKKAEDLKILNMEGKSSITEYMVIATGTSEPHLKALRNEIEKTLKAHNIHVCGQERDTASGWVVVDGFDFMIHLFTQEKRDYYSLESLWKDAEEIPYSEPISA